MKLRIRVSTCAFRVPVKRGRIGQERGIYAASTRALQSAQRFAGPSEILARFGIQASACAARNFASASPLFTLKRPEGRAPQPPTPWRAEAKRRRLDPFSLRAFTLIELLTVIAIIGILAALVAPVFIHFTKPDVTEAATRQMLDDVARARQLAISHRSTVYVVFIPENFWGNPVDANTTPWAQLPAAFRTSTVMTQMYGAQLTGYMMVSLRSVGDQPGQPLPRDLQAVKTLPDGSFISPIKFTSPAYPGAPLVIQSQFPMYGFLTTNNIPFPSAAVLGNSGYAATFNSRGGLTLPYIAFNYLGQLTPGDGSVLPYDEYIPLAYGKVLPSRDPNSKAYTQGLPSVTEVPAGGSTSISYNLIHVDRNTGRARVERQEVL